MYIHKIIISNWRSVKNLEVDANKLMVIIGQNNHGKSNLLSALLFFFGEIKHQDLDFNFGAKELFVQIEFTDLDESDRTTFKKYITSSGNIIVRKTAYIGGNFDYRGFIENPEDEWLQESNASAYTKRETAESLPFYVYLPSSGRLTKQHIVDAQINYIANNLSTIAMNFELEKTNFLGLKSVAKGIFGEVYFIPAVKEAVDDFTSKDSSTFGKIYAEIISSLSENNVDWKETRDKLSVLFSALNKNDNEGNKNSSRPQQLIDFETEITKELESWGAHIEIEVTPPDIDSVFKANTQVWVNDGVRTDIRRKGHGLQRALTVALVHVIAARFLGKEDGNIDGEQSSRKPSKSRYFIFEEPELYLHPQAQRALFDSFVSLSKKESQVILCTHSSLLIDVELYKSIYIVTKDNESVGTKIKSCNEDIFDGDAKKNFNLAYWINPDRSELFFAKKVLLVEGQTDKTIIPLLAKRLDVFKYDYTVIDCGSKDNIPAYARLLNKFNIPYMAIFDKDHQDGKSTDAINSANRSTTLIQDCIDLTLGESLIFDNDIEEEIGLEKGSRNKPYLALEYVYKTSFLIPDELERKIRKIYS
jgi:CRISPR-associated exonuclease Cas4